MDPYQSLANGIIVQAAEEYLFALRKLKRNPKHKKAADKRIECEGFFQSEWFQYLTDLDGDALMQKLHEEVFN